MAKTRVVFDGHDLTELCICSDLVRQFMPRAVGASEVSGRNGTVYTGVTAEPLEITMRLTVADTDLAARSDKWRQLAAILAVGEPRRLEISDDGGKYYMAVPRGGDVERFANAESVEVGFICPDPAMYGSKQIVFVDGGAYTLDVGGNMPTFPKLSVESARGGASEVFSVAVGDQAFSFGCSASGDTRATADSRSRTLEVNGVRTLPLLTSDWIELSPGESELTVAEGTGTITIEWEERWL